MIFDFHAFADLIAEKVAARLARSLGDEVLTLQQAAALLQLHENTVRQHAQRGTLPGRKFGDTWRFRRSALLDHVTPTDSAPLRVRQSLDLAGD